jgi:hypothetical protein
MRNIGVARTSKCLGVFEIWLLMIFAMSVRAD